MSTPHAPSAAARPVFQTSALARAARIALVCASAPVLAYPLMAQAQATSSDANPSTLPNITVKAARSEAATTEHNRSFAAKKATVGKTAQDLRDIPQPVTVLTRELLEQRMLLDLTDVLQNTTGVTVDYTDSERLSYHSRGYQIDALQIDGLNINQGAGAATFIQPDTAVLDRVEVLRGASGMLRGSGNPSAAVNMVRKRPTSEFQGSVEATVGSWDRRRLVGDISSPLNQSGSLRGRVVAVTDKKEFFQKARQENRKVLYGVLEADLSSRTRFTASLQHTDLNATGAWGNLPVNFDGTRLDLPRDTYLGASWNKWNRYNQQAFAELEHRFDNDWTVKLSAAHTRTRIKGDEGFKQTSFARTSTVNPYLVNVSTSIYGGDASDQDTLALIANGPFQLLGRKHELVLGVESQRVKEIGTEGRWGLNPVNGIDIRTWNPDTSATEPFLASGGGTYYKGPDKNTRQQGAYATTRLSITDPLDILLGARMSWWETEAPLTPTSASSNYSMNREITPYAGVVYDLTKTVSAYASYTEIFVPQSSLDINNKVLDPIRGEDIEAGLKGEFFGGRLNASLGLFSIENVGKAMLAPSLPNPCNGSGCYYVADGKTRSQGWELELSGEVVPGWQVMGGYTNTRTKYVKDSTASNAEKPLRSNDPRHAIKLFTTYQLRGALQGLTIGGGAQIQSDTYVTSGSVTARQGGYAVYNAMASYRIDKTYSVQLNANNVFDKVYYKKYTATGFSTYYGDPLNVMLTLRAAF